MRARSTGPSRAARLTAAALLGASLLLVPAVARADGGEAAEPDPAAAAEAAGAPTGGGDGLLAGAPEEPEATKGEVEGIVGDAVLPDDPSAANGPAADVDPGCPEGDAPADGTGASDEGAGQATPSDDGGADAGSAPDAGSDAAPEVELSAVEPGWHREGDAWLWYDEGASSPRTGWLVTDVSPTGAALGTQRYWLGEGGALARGVLVDAGDGWVAYATPDGPVVRGKWTDPATGYVYLADNDGRLEAAGWVVSSAYGNGTQRYWVDEAARACVPGVSQDGWAHYTTSAGYVLRGSLAADPGVLLADNDGLLATVDGDEGWLVSDAYGSGLQRYRLRRSGDACYALTGHFEVDGSHYFGLPSGYVLRGKLRMGGIGMLLADNDGVLAWEGGWLVTDAYDGPGNYQRYRIDDAPGSGLMGAHLGYFEIDGSAYYGRDREGYVVRGLYISPAGDVYYGDNDGRLGASWLSTAGKLAWARVMNEGSSTGYIIAVDCSRNHVVVFSGRAGSWTPVYDWVCTTGASSTPTVKGTFVVASRGLSFGSGFTCWYWTQFYGDYLFHSILYNPGSMSSVQDGRLGINASHGCVRLPLSQAKWIYDNIPRGTKVVIY